MSKKRGIDEPNYTQYPNIVLDEYIKLLSGAEFKIISVIIRYTFGYHRTRHRMSLSFIESKTGLSRDTVNTSLQGLLDKDLIARRASGQSFAYEMLVRLPDQSENLTTDSQKIGPPATPEVVRKSDPVKESINKTSSNKAAEEDDVFRVYERVTGRLITGGTQPEELRDMESQYPIGWIRDAFRAAVNSGARNPIAYAWTCLKNWQLDGHPDTKPKRPDNGGATRLRENVVT